MKKTIFITVGSIIVLLVIGVWAYLFTFGTPKSAGDVFAKFGAGGEEILPTVTVDTTTVDVGDTTNTGVTQKLRQLTTRPVAGAVIVSDTLTYAEQGTGHIYQINLTDGTETLVRGTTVPQTIDAVFSDDGTYVALTTYIGNATKVVVDTLGSENDTPGITLPEGVSQISFTGSGTIAYLIQNDLGSMGYAYNLKKASTATLFKIPLRDVRVLWGNPVYVYTTPTASQLGYIYTATINGLGYVSKGRAGLMGTRYDTGVVITELSNKTLTSSALERGTGVVTGIPIPALAEKCTQNPIQKNTLYCASPVSISEGTFPDDWYKGKISLTDLLWKIDTLEGGAVVLSNFLAESGREIDVVEIGTDKNGKYIYLINKNDNSLWMFDTTL